MNIIEKELLKHGIIDNPIKNIRIDEWFNHVAIEFTGYEKNVIACEFNNCFEISFSHDRNYSKTCDIGGQLDYQYFVQDIEVSEQDSFIIFHITAWPFDGKIICKSININKLGSDSLIHESC